MARFYTNENMPLPVAEELRNLGHDVLTVAESGNGGTAFPDHAVIDFAISQNRILVTLNRRHFIKLHMENSSHSGIVVCSFDPDFKGQARKIHDIVSTQESMQGQLTRINRTNI